MLNAVSYSESIMHNSVENSNIFCKKLLLILEIFRIIGKLVSDLSCCSRDCLTKANLECAARRRMVLSGLVCQIA
jgi:hypothetical protein